MVEPCLFARRGLGRVERHMLEPVALVDIVLVEQQGVGVQVLHSLELLVDEFGGESGTQRRGLGERSHAFKSGLLHLEVPWHGVAFGRC